MTSVPRLVIGGVASGVGKTTVVVGLARALAARGLRVAAFKVGPDYLDPSYHRLAVGSPCHNLDGWMMGADAVRDTFARASEGADVALIEGVMGLFDGVAADRSEGSTAELARWLEAPVLLVADAGGMARSLAAVVAGFAGFEAGTGIAGVVANRVGSRGHLELLRRALPQPAVVGGLPKAPELAFPERHLGLRTADGAVDDARFDAWGARVSEWFDVDAILALARGAPPLVARAAAGAVSAPRSCRVGVAHDAAFHFYYEHNLHALERAGAELIRFSPIADATLPDVDALYIGGGYPELHAAALAGNRSMREDIARFASARPVYAECGGFMYLCRALRTRDGADHDMVGVFPATAVIHGRLQALGYVEVDTAEASALGPAGTRFRGHQFRYSTVDDMPDDIDRVYAVRRRRDGALHAEGYRRGPVLASYVHAHFASNPALAEHLVGCAIEATRVTAS